VSCGAKRETPFNKVTTDPLNFLRFLIPSHLGPWKNKVCLIFTSISFACAYARVEELSV
jgi:hypothetical protein